MLLLAQNHSTADFQPVAAAETFELLIPITVI